MAEHHAFCTVARPRRRRHFRSLVVHYGGAGVLDYFYRQGDAAIVNFVELFWWRDYLVKNGRVMRFLLLQRNRLDLVR